MSCNFMLYYPTLHKEFNSRVKDIDMTYFTFFLITFVTSDWRISITLQWPRVQVSLSELTVHKC